MRLSAMGDVVLTVPIVREVARYNRVIVLTKPLFRDFFLGIQNVVVISADTSGAHKGLMGLFRLYHAIESNEKIDLVLDLHNVIRSRILSVIYRISGRKVFTIDKGRKAKKRFIRKPEQDDLIHTTERYRRVFDIAGIKTGNPLMTAFVISDKERAFANNYLSGPEFQNKKLIVVAPFAKHLTKQWPISLMKVLLSDLAQTGKVHTFLLGGKNEKESLSDLAAGLDNTTVLAGELTIRQELATMSMMDVMISMDSSNLHMAAVSGIKTISLWGGTHPGIGFGPIGSQSHSIIQIPLEEIECRPCTIYGKGDCRLKENKFKCLYYIRPQMILDELRKMQVL